MRRSRTLVVLLLAAASFLPPASTAAQNVILDEGTFTLTVDGREVGVERFEVRRSGSGDDARIYSSAVIEYDDGEEVLEANLWFVASSNRVPLGYQHRVSGGDNALVEVRPGDRRFVAVIKTDAGERERQLRALPGVVFLEGRVVHQYFFLPGDVQVGASVPVIVPREGRQTVAEVTGSTAETLGTGRDAVQSTKLTLVVDGETRLVWLGPEGRVLRVQIPERGFLADRTER